MSAISLDAGTSVVKAVRFDDLGRPESVARRTTPVHNGPGGRSEQDMDAVWDAAAQAIAEVATGATDPIRFVGVTGQGDGCWLVDDDGFPTGPAILWNDARAADVVDRWQEEGLFDAIFAINGRIAFPGTAAAILAWLAKHDPDRIARSHLALSCGSWLFHRLTSQHLADPSDACSTFLDTGTGHYSSHLMDLLGLPWAHRLLPPLASTENRIRELDTAAATHLGLPAGTPVVLSPFDIPATAIGIGTVSPGQGCTVLGTTLSTQVVLDHPVLTGPPRGMTLPSGLPHTHIHAEAAMAGTGVLSWFQATLGVAGPAELAAVATTSPPGAGGLYVQPYFSPAGERAPIRAPHARGALIGLSFEHTIAHIARAVFEGLSYVVRDCLNAISRPISELRLCGGGANSDMWCQLIADVTGVPTVRTADNEIGAKGAFITGLLAIGALPGQPKAVMDLIQIRDRFEPDPANVRRYELLFAEYLALRSKMATEWHNLATLRQEQEFKNGNTSKENMVAK